MLTTEQINELRKPFKPEAIKHKQQTNPKNSKPNPKAGGREEGWGTVIFYVDARDVAERLDKAVLGQWSDDYGTIAGTFKTEKALECRLTVCGVTRKDVGEADSPKELYSDAFKRAAVKFGVGAFLYRLPNIMCKMVKNSRGQWELTSEAQISIQKMKVLAQGAEGWPDKFSDVFLLSDFQAGEDFSEPEEKKPAGHRTLDTSTMAGSRENVIVQTPQQEASISMEYALASPLPPVPLVVKDMPLVDLIAPFDPLNSKVQAAKQAMGIPAEQTPVRSSDPEALPITEPQRKKLMAKANSYNITDKASIQSLLGFLLKRVVTSSNEISKREASALLDSDWGQDIATWRDANREGIE